MVWRFWRAIAHNALEETLKAIRYDTGARLMIGAFMVLAILAALYFWGSPDAWKDESLARATPILLVFAAFPIIYLWYFFRTPALLHSALEVRLTRLEDRLRPRLTLSLAPNPNVVLPFGSVSASMGGNRFFNVTRQMNTLCLMCQNNGALRIEGCEAHLVYACHIDALGDRTDIGFGEKIALPWSQDFKSLKATINPGFPHPLYVLQMVGAKYVYVFRDQDIPMSQQQLFLKPGKYRLWIQVMASDECGCNIVLDVSFDGVEERFTVSDFSVGADAQSLDRPEAKAV